MKTLKTSLTEAIAKVSLKRLLASKPDILGKLEQIKKAGNYAVTLYYGEDIGCDDLDVKPEERKILIVCHPVGCLGSVRTIFNGNLKTFINFNPKEKPKQLNNPPEHGSYDEHGFYAFGTDDMIKHYYERFAG